MKDQRTNDKEIKFRIAQGVYLGLLMSPSDVARATAARIGPAYAALQRWTLCGDVSPTVCEVLQVMQKQARANERVTAFSSAAGNGYVVFTHQVGCFQHRYFLPLFDSKVAQCLADITHDGALGYSLAGESRQAVVWPSCLGPRDFLPLRDMCGTVAEGQEEAALEEYARMLGEARDPARIPSVVEGVTVRYVSVSAIPPSDVMAQLSVRYGVRV